ncbi:hypothetical protein R3P38DRAFT_2799399 [Favolaschia claudopus]|uniref:Uncharacterized protein n=1 Tax=Favolaschia claudopus TaxID=2862362 RepID=A0AAV9ZZL6_9AGAR
MSATSTSDTSVNETRLSRTFEIYEPRGRARLGCATSIRQAMEDTLLRADGYCNSAGLCVQELLGPYIMEDALDLRIVDIATTKNVSCWKRHQRLKLASVDLHVVRCTVPVDVAFPPSSNLQYMHIASDRDQQRVNWSAFFSACTNLVHLKWDRRCALAPSPVVTLPSLLRLTLWDLRFLPPIFAPRLTELEVFDYSMPNHRVFLRNNPVKTLVLLDILKKTPYLEHILMSRHGASGACLPVLGQKDHLPVQDEHHAQADCCCGSFNPPNGRKRNFVWTCAGNSRTFVRLASVVFFNCLCFEPFAFGTSIVIPDFPFPLTKREVAAVYSRDEVTSYTGFKVPVLKVWGTRTYTVREDTEGQFDYGSSAGFGVGEKRTSWRRLDFVMVVLDTECCATSLDDAVDFCFVLSRSPLLVAAKNCFFRCVWREQVVTDSASSRCNKEELRLCVEFGDERAIHNRVSGYARFALA